MIYFLVLVQWGVRGGGTPEHGVFVKMMPLKPILSKQQIAEKTFSLELVFLMQIIHF